MWLRTLHTSQNVSAKVGSCSVTVLETTSSDGLYTGLRVLSTGGGGGKILPQTLQLPPQNFCQLKFN